LIVEKELAGFADRDDVQTYVDLHDADEGRIPKFSGPTEVSKASRFTLSCAALLFQPWEAA
jgi:hypothetical protein